ncbi:MAG TPA: DUF6069 family protein [Mycobacterium sp.]|nr:DUF6069 family protein [Mycobacterium sp.]
MTEPYEYDPRPPAPHRRRGSRIHVDAARLRAGGVTSALIAALLAVVGILLTRGVFDVAVLAAKRNGTWGNANTLTYAVCAFAFGPFACALMHVLLLWTPSPYTFFGSILALRTIVGAFAPFTTGADTGPKSPPR